MLLALLACDPATEAAPEPECAIEEAVPDYANELGCWEDYDKLASLPLDASIPGAQSVKTLVDRYDDNRLYFTNSRCYPIHWDFASEFLSGNGLPPVGDLSLFNTTEYYSPDRRFLLGSVNYYSGPEAWAYELAPYDTADADMVATAYELIQSSAYFGGDLAFHPTSVDQEELAEELPSSVKIVTTGELFEGIDYQPLNTGTTTGILRFHAAEDVDGTYTPFRELVVLDRVPNDISIVAGIITADFQTPLAHINVLSVNRGTPNMALRGAQENATLLALEGKWVSLTVTTDDWHIEEITEAEAEAYWEAHKPEPITVTPMDLSVTDLRDLDEIVDSENLASSLSANIPAFGAKATNYAGLREIGEPVPVQDGFAIPMYYYNQFMEDHGLWTEMESLMASEDWADPDYREGALEEFKDRMREQPMREEVVALITEQFTSMYPNGEKARFRSSTNAEDLGDFVGAGLYNSETGDPAVDNPDEDSIEWAVKKVWSQVWNPRAYEEREYYSMNHLDVGMGLLVAPNFPEEEANGVAITGNIYDATGLEPGFYVNAQYLDYDVVLPDEGVIPDAYIHYYYQTGSPIVYILHSSFMAEGETVLTRDQSQALGDALDAINTYFAPAYASDDGSWWALEVDWKFDDKNNPGTPELFVKQARPFHGWSGAAAVEGSGECDGAE